MEKYKYDESNGLWYELQGDYYLPCLKLPEEKHQPIGICLYSTGLIYPRDCLIHLVLYRDFFRYRVNLRDGIK